MLASILGDAYAIPIPFGPNLKWQKDLVHPHIRVYDTILILPSGEAGALFPEVFVAPAENAAAQGEHGVPKVASSWRSSLRRASSEARSVETGMVEPSCLQYISD